MFFGSYLVRKGIIKIEDFIACATEQIKSNKTYLEILYENSLLSAEQILTLVDDQFESKKTFSQIISEKNLIDASKLRLVLESSSSLQKSFSEILRDKSILGQEDLVKHYAEYEKNLVSEPEVNNAGESVEISSAALESLKELEGVDMGDLVETKSEEIGGDISAAALESLKEIDANAAKGISVNNPESNAFVSDFLETFSEQLYNKLNKIITIIFKTADEEGDFSNFFNSLFRELHIIKGSARLANFSKIEKALDEWEESIEFFFKLPDNQKNSWLTENGDSLKKLVDLCWDIRNQIAEKKSEIEISENKFAEFSGLCQELKQAS